MQLYDGVTIPPDGKFPSMTGVIVYKKDDTIGIRLTGESEGMGDHSGNVDGIDYFECPVNSGVLTTIDKVDPRKLTFSEENLIRSLLQPKPAYSTPMASSVPISGLSPAALARMMQLNQRMGITPTNADTTPRNKLPPSAATPGPQPPTPQLSDPPTSYRSSMASSTSADADAANSSPQGSEPALAEEKPQEKRLSRLEILRQKKEAIRKRKLALQEKVEGNKKEKQQQEEEEDTKKQQEQQQEQQEASAPDAAAPQEPSGPQQSDQPMGSTTAAAPMVPDEAASVKTKTSSDSVSKASRASRDSIEQLWITELRHESPASAVKYDMEDAENLLLEEDEMEEEQPQSSVKNLQEVFRQAPVQHDSSMPVEPSRSEGAVDEDEEHEGPFRRSSLSRLQQLRQKKRLLEALPASIQTPVAPPAIHADVVLEDVQPPSPHTLAMAQQHNNSLANMAVASAAALGHQPDSNTASFPEQSRPRVQERTDDEESHEEDEDAHSTAVSDHSMEDSHLSSIDHGVYDAVPDAFRESVTITSGTTNPLPASEHDLEETKEAPSPAATNSHKRRRMLGLGFLPGINRQQKRQNTGQGQQQ